MWISQADHVGNGFSGLCIDTWISIERLEITIITIPPSPSPSPSFPSPCPSPSPSHLRTVVLVEGLLLGVGDLVVFSALCGHIMWQSTLVFYSPLIVGCASGLALLSGVLLTFCMNIRTKSDTSLPALPISLIFFTLVWALYETVLPKFVEELLRANLGFIRTAV